MNALTFLILAAFFFLLFRCCSLEIRIETLESGSAFTQVVNSELINRLEIQYRFTENVMKRVKKMEHSH